MPRLQFPRPGALPCCALAVALQLAACTLVKPPQAPASAPAAQPAAAASSALRTEQRWLQSWFEGTPVKISMDGDDVLAVEVPREFCFDAGRSQIKPALAAVLDKVAQSLRRNPSSRVGLLAGPSDAAGAAPTLATARASAVHLHLRNRGVAGSRLGTPVAGAPAGVQLRIEASPA